MECDLRHSARHRETFSPCSRANENRRRRQTPRRVVSRAVSRLWSFPIRLDPSKAQSRQHPRLAKRSEEHTSELQSRLHLVCRLLLEKKKNHDCCHTPDSSTHPTATCQRQ